MVISYEDVKIAPAYTFVGVIIVILLFSDTIGVGIFVDEWMLTQVGGALVATAFALGLEGHSFAVLWHGCRRANSLQI